jgi:ATP-binding cassette subfamily F protein uup
MDEPTNDLDVETLELLEDLLLDYAGTLLLVSHDRDFLDHVVTSTLVMEGDGRVGEFVGGYTDWLRQGGQLATESAPAKAATKAAPPAPAPALPPATRRKLSYKDTRELEQLPARIEALEARLAELTARSGDPAFYQGAPGAITAHNAELAQVQVDLDAAYARWAELEG